MSMSVISSDKGATTANAFGNRFVSSDDLQIWKLSKSTLIVANSQIFSKETPDLFDFSSKKE
jgi:hypothetical protein